MASDLVRFQDLRVISLATLPNPRMDASKIHLFIKEARDDIARKLPLLKRIELRWEGWEKDPATKQWMPIQGYTELLRTQGILRKQIITRV